MHDRKRLLTKLLEAVRTEVGENSVSIRVDCRNFETVYVEEIGDGRYLAYDRYKTLKFLCEHDGSTYKSIEELGVDRIHQICELNGVQLIDVFPDDEAGDSKDEHLAIAQYVELEDTVADIVQRVSVAIEAVFSSACD